MNEALRSLVNEVKNNEEEVVWVEKPDSGKVLILAVASLGLTIFVALFNLIIFGIIIAQKTMHGGSLSGAIISAVLGAVTFGTAFTALYLFTQFFFSMSRVYAVTNSRFLIVNRKKHCIVKGLELKDISRVSSKGLGGYILFETKNKQGAPEKIDMMGIPDPGKVVEVIKQNS